MIEATRVQELLEQAFPDGTVELTDLTGTQDHYQARIVSQAFSGKTPIAQHKLVYAALGELMSGPIHALALETYTPEAWQRKQG